MKQTPVQRAREKLEEAIVRFGTARQGHDWASPAAYEDVQTAITALLRAQRAEERKKR
jgi:hypothetical protein